jgi:regulator of replication initiation timing
MRRLQKNLISYFNNQILISHYIFNPNQTIFNIIFKKPKNRKRCVKMGKEDAEIKKFNEEIQTLIKKADILESSLKSSLKENTVLRVDLNVLKTRIKELEKTSDKSGIKSLNTLQSQIDYKIQECDDLRNQLKESKDIIFELEKKILGKAPDKDIKKLENQIQSQNQIIQGLQKDNEDMKKSLGSAMKKSSKSVKIPIKKTTKKKANKKTSKKTTKKKTSKKSSGKTKKSSKKK